MRRVLLVVVSLALAGPFAPTAEAQLTDLLRRGADAVRQQAGRATEAGADAATVSQTVSVRDVDLATLKSRLSRVGVEIPIQAEGQVSATLTVTARLAQLTRSGAITATGRLTSPELTFAPIESATVAAAEGEGNGGAAGNGVAEPIVVRDVRADLSLAEGVLTLDDLSLKLPLGRRTGTVTGSAKLPLAGSDDVASATVNTKGVPLDLLWDRLAEELPVDGGTFTGSVTASVPWPRRADPAAYTATARASATGLSVAGRAVDDLDARLSLKQGVARLDRLTATVAGQPLRGTASTGLAAPYPVRAEVVSERFDLSILDALFPPDRFPDGPPAWLPRDLAGTLNLALGARGTLDPLAANLSARLRGGTANPADGRNPVRVNDLTITALAGNLAATLEDGAASVTLEDLRVQTEAGAVTADATATLSGRPGDAGSWSATVEGDGLSPRLLEAAPVSLRPQADEAGEAGGAGALAVTGEAGGTLEPPALNTAEVTLSGADLVAFGLPVEEISAALTVADGTTTLSEARIVTDRGTFTGNATFGPEGWRAEGRLNDVTTAALDLIPECFRPSAEVVGRTGRLAAAGWARGSTGPFALEKARATVKGAGLRVFSLPIDAGAADVRFENDVLNAADLDLTALGGSLTGSVATDFNAPDLPLTGELTLTDVDLARLPPDLLPEGYALTGTAAAQGTLDLRFPPPPDPDADSPDADSPDAADPDAADPDDPCGPRRGFRVASAQGTASLDRPALTLPGGQAVRVNTASVKATVADGAARFEDLSVTAVAPFGQENRAERAANGRLTGSGAVELAAPHRFRTKLRWDDWPTDSLLRPLLAAAGVASPAPDAAPAPAGSPARRGTTLGFVSATGTLVPPDLATGEGVLRAADVRLPGLAAGVSIPALAAEFALTPERLRVKSVSAEFSYAPEEPSPSEPTPGLAGPPAPPATGRLTASGEWARAAPHEWEARIDAKSVPLALIGPALTAAAAASPEGLGLPPGLPLGPGAFAGTVDLTADLSGTADPAALRGNATLNGRSARAFGIDVDALALETSAGEKAVTIDRFALEAGSATATGRATLSTAGARPWEASLNIDGADPAELTRRLAPLLPPVTARTDAGLEPGPVSLSGPLSVDLKANGRLEDGRWRARGDLDADRLALTLPPDRDFPGLGPVVLNRVDTTFAVNRPVRGPIRLTVDRFTAELAGGELFLTASAPLPDGGLNGGEPGAPGEAKLSWTGGDVGALLRAASPPRFDPLLGGTPPPFTGAATVQISAAWPGGRLSLANVGLRARVTSDRLLIVRRPGAARPVRLNDLLAEAELFGGTGKGSLTARGFGGSLGAAVAFRPVPRRAAPGSSLPRGSSPLTARLASWPFRVIAAGGAKDADLAALEAVLRAGAARPVLRGEADACLRFDSHPDGPPVDLAALLPGVAPPPGCDALPTTPPAEVEPRSRAARPPRLTGIVRVRDVSLSGRRLLSEAALSVAARDGNSWSGEVANGRYAGGIFRLLVAAPPASSPEARSGALRVDVRLTDADAARAFAPIPWVGENVAGRVGGRVAGTVGPRGVQLAGALRLDRGGFLAANAPGRTGGGYHLDVERWRIPVDLAYRPAEGSGRVRFSGTSAGIGGGTVDGGATVDFGRGRGVGLDIDATLNRVDSRILTRGAGGELAGGRVSGAVRLAGRNVDGLEDLEGAVRLSLLNASPKSLPVLRALRPFLRFRGSAAARRGELSARLRNAVLRLERLTLSGPGVRLYATGTAALPAGRLDLEVIADTGERDVTEEFLLRLVEQAAGPTPVGFALRACRLLRDRIVYLDVGGTVRRPRVRVQTARQVQEEAIRFLLGELFVPTSATRGAAPPR